MSSAKYRSAELILANYSRNTDKSTTSVAYAVSEVPQVDYDVDINSSSSGYISPKRRSNIDADADLTDFLDSITFVNEDIDIDWDEGLDAYSPSNLSSKRSPPISFHDKDIDTSDEDGRNKLQRTGSLQRIITTISLAVAADPPETTDLESLKSEIPTAFINCVNLADNRLMTELILKMCSEVCCLYATCLRSPISGVRDIVMFWSLMFEIFPDGVCKLLTQSGDDSKTRLTYSFQGTRLFSQSIDTLYCTVKEQAAESTSAICGEIALDKLNRQHWSDSSLPSIISSSHQSIGTEPCVDNNIIFEFNENHQVSVIHLMASFS